MNKVIIKSPDLDMIFTKEKGFLKTQTVVLNLLT